MADKPILFSGPMVRALLAGTKTQTRRIIKLQPFIDDLGNFCAPDRKGKVWNYGQDAKGIPHIKKFAESELRIKTGDWLWVRETWTARMTHGWTIADARSRLYQEQIIYQADSSESIDGWWPSIHMPREFSRLTLTVTEVRVERLQDISEEDAAAEGVKPWHHGEWFDVGFGGVESKRVPARTLYAALWDEINGKGSWEANPWVAAYSFTIDRGNIDELGKR